jgi:hypothetical protein
MGITHMDTIIRTATTDRIRTTAITALTTGMADIGTTATIVTTIITDTKGDVESRNQIELARG